MPWRLFTSKKHINTLRRELNNYDNEITRLKRELVQKNELVKNISFQQSHTVRRPLANILGIIELLNNSHPALNDPEILEMIGLLKISADDLDKAIKHNSGVGNV